MLHCCHS